jgi:CHAD domain-containing protein
MGMNPWFAFGANQYCERKHLKCDMTKRTSAKVPSAGDSAARSFLLRRFIERQRHYDKSLQLARKKVSEKNVHDLRISVRRMLALLELMGPFCRRERLLDAERRLNKFFKTSGLLRDVQAQRCAIQKELKRFPELAHFHKWLTRREERLARRFEKHIRCGAKPKLKAALLALHKGLRKAANKEKRQRLNPKDYLAKADARYQHLVELRAAVRANCPSTIHCLRIAFKAYRYMVEILKPEVFPVSQASLAAMREYQGVMGEIQDNEMLLARMRKYEKAKRRITLSAFRSELKRRHAELINRFLAAPFPPNAGQG